MAQSKWDKVLFELNKTIGELMSIANNADNEFDRLLAESYREEVTTTRDSINAALADETDLGPKVWEFNPSRNVWNAYPEWVKDERGNRVCNCITCQHAFRRDQGDNINYVKDSVK